jgi:hypothetical protein
LKWLTPAPVRPFLGIAKMADDKQSEVGVGGNNLVILAIAAVSAIYFGWQKPALETFRPTESEHQVHPIGNLQNVDARLWQDGSSTVKRRRQPTSC